jgi:hypothetical protein
MIRSQHLGAIAERPTVVKKQEVKAEHTPTICKECGIDKRLPKRGITCSACNRYRLLHGVPRPATLIQRELAKRNAIKWCEVCGHPDIYALQKCKLCHDYWLAHKKARPRWLWDKDICCSVCGFPKKALKRGRNGRLAFRKDKCLPCDTYQREQKRPRPAYLWGKGSKGWCDCGYPAEHQIDGFTLCNRCVKDYR